MKHIRSFISVTLLLVMLTGCGIEKPQSNNSQTNNDIVKSPIYKKSVITSDEFLSTWLVPLSTLSINSDTVTEIEVNDSKNLPACTFFIKDNDTLILYGGGTFFQLKKAA